MNNAESVTVDVKTCARCGGDHPIDFTPFSQNPIECNGVEYTHWGICRNTGEPVIMIIREVEETVE